MKKYLFIILCLALAFVSCKKNNESNENEEPQPIDSWVGSYAGEVGAEGTLISEPIGLLTDTIFNKTLSDLTMKITRLTSQKALVTINYGVLPIPFKATINGTTATIEDTEYIPSFQFPITVGSVTFDIEAIKFSQITLHYNDGIVTGSGDAVITGEATIGIIPAKLTLSLDLTPYFTKK